MTPSASYRVGRSRFPAPTREQIFAGPLLHDGSGIRIVTRRFATAKDDIMGGPVHPGHCGFKQGGIVFFPEKPTSWQDGAEAVELGLDQLELPELFELAGLAFSIFAESKSRLTARDYLADPRSFVLPFLDVVAVSVVQVDGDKAMQDSSSHEVVVTCRDDDGQSRHFRFREQGHSRSHQNSDDLAAAIVAMRVANDLDAAEAQVTEQDMGPYLAQAREQIAARYQDAEGRESLVSAQARQLRRQALRQSGTTVTAERDRAMQALLADLRQDYAHVREALKLLDERYGRLLTTILEDV